MKNFSLLDQLIYSTVRLEVFNRENIPIGVGSAFLQALSIDDCDCGLLITNKHVIKDAYFCKFCFTLADENNNPIFGQKILFRIGDFESQCYLHPNPDIDLCALPFGPIYNYLKNQGINIFFYRLNEGLIPSDDILTSLEYAEDIIMIGYPCGLWDKENNLPIIRRGITASHTAKDYNNKPYFLTDMSVFGGSSGSPIFIYNPGHYPNKEGGLSLGNRIFFIGINFAVFHYNINGQAEIISTPVKDSLIFNANIPNNIGLAIQSKKILDFKEIFKPLLKKSQQYSIENVEVFSDQYKFGNPNPENF
ncbi:MAG: serine protease [Candidatus Gastranaerophilales bacterium]|nr:serine protease [Candidatus Gastranaerophilales bacterium]